MAKLKVESNIPIPERRGDSIKYPWEELTETGQSFLVPVKERQKKSERQSGIAASLRYWKNKDPKHREHISIVTRQVEGGIRVWRTA